MQEGDSSIDGPSHASIVHDCVAVFDSDTTHPTHRTTPRHYQCSLRLRIISTQYMYMYVHWKQDNKL